MDARDTAIIRDHLINIKARIEHWKADAQSNLLPTEGSLATCKTHHAIAIVNAMNDATALSALSARPSVNETLERAAKKLEEMKRLLMSQTVVLDVTADCAVYDLAAAAIRKMKEPG